MSEEFEHINKEAICVKCLSYQQKEVNSTLSERSRSVEGMHGHK